MVLCYCKSSARFEKISGLFYLLLSTKDFHSLTTFFGNPSSTNFILGDSFYPATTILANRGTKNYSDCFYSCLGDWTNWEEKGVPPFREEAALQIDVCVATPVWGAPAVGGARC